MNTCEKTRLFKYINFSTNVVIAQDTGKQDFCVVHRTPDISSDIPLRNNSGFQPGILSILDGKLILTLVDYDDNGTFTFIEKTRSSDGLVSEFDGVYCESGYGSNLLQIPTVGKLTLVKTKQKLGKVND